MMRIAVRRTLSLLLMFLITATSFAVTSCSILDRSELLSNQMKIEAEHCEAFESAFFEALEKKDAKSITKLFSPRARSRTPDLDEGIEYLFTVCGGEKITAGKDNKSSLQNIEKGRNTWEMDAYCFFSIGDHEYMVSWVEFLKYDEDERMIGIYSIDITDKEETEKRDYPFTAAGIYHPGRYEVNQVIKQLVSLYTLDHTATDREPKYEIPDESEWNYLWDPDVYAGLDQQDKDDMAHYFINDRSRTFYAGWYEFPDEGGVVFYCPARFALHHGGCFGIRFNDDNKIVGISLDIYHAAYTPVEEGIHGFDDTRSTSGENA
ncbi:MAG: DUF5104 domain-containing protein [Clostridiales bacterium]|nr:DUF5104 domain-containing protein [Clostridiales bacterium]